MKFENLIEKFGRCTGNAREFFSGFWVDTLPVLYLIIRFFNFILFNNIFIYIYKYKSYVYFQYSKIKYLTFYIDKVVQILQNGKKSQLIEHLTIFKQILTILNKLFVYNKSIKNIISRKILNNSLINL